MAHELYLRPGTSGLEPDEILGKLCGALGVSAPEGEAPRAVEILEGGTRGMLREVTGEAGEAGPLGADLQLPYGALLPEVEGCVRRVLQASVELSLVVFDPQLGVAVALGDLPRIVERYGEDSAYHVHLTGTAEDLRQGMASAEEANPYRNAGVTVQVKVILGLVMLLLFCWIFFRACVISPMIDQLAGDEAARIPEKGPPPGWLTRHPPVLAPAAAPAGDAAADDAAE